MSPTSDKSQIWQQLQHYSQFPDFNNYLAFILARAEGKPSEVQQAAGLLLKNNLRTAFKSMAPPYQQYIKSELLPCLGAADRHIRSTAGTIISVVVQIGGVFGWPELLHTLVKCLESNELKHMEGGMDALSKICEDIPQVLDADMPGLTELPINVFLPRLLQLFQSPHASLRKLSLGSVNQYIMLMPEALYMSMDKYLQGLFILANDPAAKVQKLEIEGFLTHSCHEIGKVLVMLLLLCILDMVFSLLGMMQRLDPFGKSLFARDLVIPKVVCQSVIILPLSK